MHHAQAQTQITIRIACVQVTLRRCLQVDRFIHTVVDRICFMIHWGEVVTGRISGWIITAKTRRKKTNENSIVVATKFNNKLSEYLVSVLFFISRDHEFVCNIRLRRKRCLVRVTALLCRCKQRNSHGPCLCNYLHKRKRSTINCTINQERYHRE